MSTLQSKVTFSRKQDIDASLIAALNSFNSEIADGDFTGATAVLTANPTLLKTMIMSADWNSLVSCMESLEDTFFGEIQTYLREAVSYKGVYSATTKYKKFDMVNYNGSTYMCMNDATIIGTLPTNTTYWEIKIIKGDKGDSGTGLTPKGIWSSSVAYVADDFVSYSNKWWYCAYGNTNSKPSSSNTNWRLLYDFSSISAEDIPFNTSSFIDDVDNVHDALTALSNNSLTISRYNVTISSSKWTTSSPYTYTITVPSSYHVDANTIPHYDINNQSVTSTQYEAFLDSYIVVTGTGTNSIYLKALNEAPTVDIPMTFDLFNLFG